MKIQFNLIADTPNKNDTIYPKNVLKKAIEKFNEEKVKQGKAFGIIGQPILEDVNLTEVAFKINELDEIDKSYVADIEILGTPNGKKLKKFVIDNLENYRIVTLGYGTIKKDEDGNRVIKKMKITGIGIEPIENCA